MNVIRKAEELEYANIQRTGTPGHYTKMDWYRPCSSSFSYFSGIWVDSAVSWSRLSCITASRTDRDGGTTPGRRSSNRQWRGSGSSMTAMALVRTLWLIVPSENRIWFMMGSGGSLCWFILSLFWLYFLVTVTAGTVDVSSLWELLLPSTHPACLLLSPDSCPSFLPWQLLLSKPHQDIVISPLVHTTHS